MDSFYKLLLKHDWKCSDLQKERRRELSLWPIVRFPAPPSLGSWRSLSRCPRPHPRLSAGSDEPRPSALLSAERIKSYSLHSFLIFFEYTFVHLPFHSGCKCQSFVPLILSVAIIHIWEVVYIMDPSILEHWPAGGAQGLVVLQFNYCQLTSRYQVPHY